MKEICEQERGTRKMGKVVQRRVLKQWHRAKTNCDVMESKECRYAGLGIVET